MSPDDLKRQAAAAAIELVRSGMKLGLGTGSTAAHFVDLLGGRVKAGLDVVCVPTSEATRVQAAALGIRLTTLDETPRLDLTVDGCDEVDDNLNLIKGGGGALLREKLVAIASERLVIIADVSKHVRQLGAFPLAVEVVRFGHAATAQRLRETMEMLDYKPAAKLRLGKDGQSIITDNGNVIYDCAFAAIEDAQMLDGVIKLEVGVVEHGLFAGLVDTAYIAGPKGVITLTQDDLDDEADDDQ